MTLRALVFGDVHLQTSRDTPSYARPDVDPSGVDVVLSVGDVIDDNADHTNDPAVGRDYEARGRAFFEHLDTAFDCPVLAVPGNHDPVDATERLAEGLDSVTVLHGDAVSADDVATSGDFEGFSFVGWGCDQFDLEPAFDYLSYAATDPRQQDDSRELGHWARERAETVQSVAAQYLAGDVTADGAASALSVGEEARPQFVDDLAAFEAEYREIRDAVAAGDGTPVVLSHETPFGVDFDHPRETSVLDSRLHCGSLPLKLALVDARIHSAFCGHFHSEGMDVVHAGRGHTYIVNLGSPGVALVELDDDAQPRVTDLVDG